MNLRNARISRPVLMLAMLTCFVPLTGLFAAVLVRDADPAWIRAGYLSAAITGPLGLFTAVNQLLLNRRSMTRAGAAALCVAATWTIVVLSAQVLSAAPALADWWRNYLLIAVLPAMGVAHLVQGARCRETGQAVT